MSRNPEARLIASINKLLNKQVYHQAMGSLFCNGTPDQYYEGPGGCVWVEYKKDEHGRVSALQQRWHDRAKRNHVESWIVYGCPEGVLLEGQKFSKRDFAVRVEKMVL